MKTALSLFCCLAGLALCAQGVKTPFLSFSDTTGSQNFFYKSVTKTDGSGNIYVAGATVNGAGNRDLLLAKYNASGNLQWIEQYDGAAHAEDFATALYIDGSGNVFVTGAVTTNTSTALPDLAAIKYNSSGVQQWLSTYDGTGHSYDAGADITLDGSGNIYVTGGAFNATPNSDIVTLKYNSSGTQQWASQFDPPTHMDDAGLKISVSGSTVTASIGSQSATAAYRFGVFKYAVATGSITGSTLTSTVTTAVDLITDMATDASGNIFLSGAVPTVSNGYDFYLIKFNSSLAVQWQQTYNGAGSLDDAASGIVADGSGNLYVSGYVSTAANGKDFVTQKYNSSGTLQWAQSYNSDADGDDAAGDIALDNSGNVYSTGYKASDINGADYYTVKYDSSGTMVWDIQSDFSHQPDMAMGLVIDSLGDVIVTGQTQTGPGTYKYYTVKYIEKDVITPTDYNGEAPADNFSYFENKGQLIGTNDTLVPDIKFYTEATYPTFFFKKNSLSMVFSRIDTVLSSIDTTHRIDMIYKGVNVSTKTYSLEQKKEYLNYYFPYLPNGVEGVFAYKKLLTPDIFPNIDVIYSSNQNGVKLYYIIKPGGNPADIQFEFSGASSYSLNGTSNALSLNSAIGSLTFDRPTAYQLTTGNATVAVTGWTPDWQTNGASNKYKFNLGSYTSSLTLVIEVDQGNLVTSTTSIQDIDWSTFYGGSSSDGFSRISIDAHGNNMVLGRAQSNDFPILGINAQPYPGGLPAVIARFNVNGVREFATYYGPGSSAFSVIGGQINNANSFYYIAGLNNGAVPFPSSQPVGSYVNTFSGVNDIFTAKFDTLGKLIWATMYGSSGNEITFDMTVDYNDNLYIVGEVLSGGFPTHSKTNAYNSSVGQGFILKFNSLNQLDWATNIGNKSTNGRVYSIVPGCSGDYFIAGITEDSLNIINLPGAANDSTYGGGAWDFFLAAFHSSNDSIYWSRYIGGPGQDADNDTHLNCVNRDIYLTSTTYSPLFPLYHIPGQYFDTIISGNSFIMKFDGITKALKWSTGFPYSSKILNGSSDNAGNFIITGASTGGLPVKPSFGSYYQSTYNGNYDGYVTIFNPHDSIIYSTYIGGSGNDVINSAAVYSNYLLLVGNSSSGQASSIIYPLSNLGGSPPAWWQPNTNTSNGVITRYNFNNSLYTGIPNIVSNEDHRLIVYPNPNNGNFNLIINNNEYGNTVIEVFDILGKRVYVKQFNYLYNNQVENVHLEGLNSGIYMISVSTKNARQCVKIIKE